MIRRFRGTIAAAVVLAVVAIAVVAIERRPDPLPAEALPDRIFRFEKDELTAFTITRPDLHLTVRKEDGEWSVADRPWRPNRSMIRRVAHQLHDLDARADIAGPGAADPARYGLGPDAIQIEVSLQDGRTLSFAVGDPNPTSVSVYMQRLPDGQIYIVKKSSMDFWRLPVDAFREDRIALFDADDADRIEAVIDGAPLDIERTGDRVYHMRAPVDQPASRDVVRTMLGRISALRANAFVRDGPDDLAGFGLDPPAHTIAIALNTGDRIEIDLGDRIDQTDPPERYVYLRSDDSVYAVRAGMIDSFRKTPDEIRDRVLVGGHEWELATTRVQRTLPDGSPDAVTLHRTSDGWRWPDRAAVAGSTPKRVAGRAAELEAIAFFDAPPPDAGLTPPKYTVDLAFEDGRTATVALGATFDAPAPDRPPPPRRPGGPVAPAPATVTHQYARVGQGPVVTVSGSLDDAIADLFREYGRKLRRDEDKGLDDGPVSP